MSDPGHPVPYADDDPAGGGTAPRRRRSVLLLGAGVGTALGAMVATGVFVAAPHLGAADCPDRAALRVVTTPELRPVVSAAVDDLARGDERCALPVAVSAEDPSTTAANLAAERGDRPDVWIPDSSVWTRRAVRPGTGVPADNPSVASSPVVLALTGGRPGRTLADLVPSPDQADSPRWLLPEPETSAATVGALVELQKLVAGHADGPARFGAVIRRSRHDWLLPEDQPAGTVLPTSEQQVFRTRLEDPAVDRPVVYGTVNFRFDFPWVVLSGERMRRDRAAEVLAALHSAPGRRLLADAGFRDPVGTAGAALTRELGDAPGRATLAPVADAATVNSAIRAYTAIIRPTRLLAAIDVSGSMSRAVPGARGATRLDLAVQASVNGLAVYPDDTMVGVWEFATNLTSTTDYQVLAPLQRLGAGDDGRTGRQNVAAALGSIAVTKGGTGLNDTVLAAVREVRRDWDPRRVNSVVVITDGGNADRHGVSTRALLATLRAENDPDRPVAVFAIAYGPSGDLASLRRISAVTGGRAYAAPDPRQIGRVLADAIGRRSCTPDC